MKALSSENATATNLVGPVTNSHEATTPSSLLTFSRSQTVASPDAHQWKQEHLGDYVMLAKIRRLPPQERAEHDAFLDSLTERVEMHRRHVREAFELSSRSLARAWGITDDDGPNKKDL